MCPLNMTQKYALGKFRGDWMYGLALKIQRASREALQLPTKPSKNNPVMISLPTHVHFHGDWCGVWKPGSIALNAEQKMKRWSLA